MHRDGSISLEISRTLVSNSVSDTHLISMLYLSKVALLLVHVPRRGRDASAHVLLCSAARLEMELIGKALYRLTHCG